MRDGRTGIIFAAATFLAGLAGMFSPGRSSPPPVPSGPGEGEDEALPNPDNVSYVAESSRVSRSGFRGTIVVMTNGAKLESTHPYEAYGCSWPVFSLSVANGGPRKVIVNPAEVVGIERSAFRRTNRTRPDTVILTTGASVVVRESIDDVRNRLGR